MVRRRDIKKSDFIAVTDSETTDYFDFVRNGQNLRIAQSDLASFLGVSGTLTTRGEATAIPVLRVISSVNYIRNILGGSGINVALSAQDGIEISHGFTVDSTGTPLITDVAASSPIVRSLQAGSGISITPSGNVIELASTAAAVSSKVVMVYGINDFPAPVGDVITLAANTQYCVQNDISSIYRYVLSDNTVLCGVDYTTVELEYTGSGAMLSSVDASIKIKDLTLTAVSGSMFSISSTTSQHLFRMINTNINCDSGGTLNALGLIYFFNTSFRNIYTNGVTFTGAFSIALFDTIGATMAAGAGNLFTLGTATFDYFTITKGLFNINTTGYIISGLANSGNINAGGYGYITNSRNFGTTDPPTDNIFYSDLRWDMFHNSQSENSYDIALATHALATLTISATTTPVKMTGPWTTQKAYRFTGDATGRWTYQGAQTNVGVIASVTADVSALGDTLSIFLYKNGAQITASRTSFFTTLNEIKNCVLVWDVELVANDYLEIWIQNDDTTANIEIHTATMRIRS